MDKYILVNDVGTTGVRAVVIDQENNIVSRAYEEITQIHPKPGWSEQDPVEIWDRTVNVTKKVLDDVDAKDAKNIAALGIVTQRSTNVLWDRKTGKPVYNAITWQDGRTVDLCEEVANKGNIKFIHGLGKAVTGISKVIKPLKKNNTVKLLIQASHLAFSPAFCPPHIKWVLDNVKEARGILAKGDLLFGTVDTWVVWNYTKGKVHATDFSNISSTGMYDPFSMDWSQTLLKPFDIPKELILPEIRESSGDFGKTDLFGTTIPITAVIADQQSALFGEACFSSGDVKCTNGTGTFVDMNTGDVPMASTHQLTPLVAWKLRGETTYMLEGLIANTGSAVQWLRDDLNAIETADETGAVAEEAKDSQGIYFVPAFEGLGAPYWDARARGTIVGITRAAKKEQIVRAVLESIGYSCKDAVEAIKKDTDLPIRSIKADGGASENDFLLQFISDIVDVEVERPVNLETTAIGAAYLAGLAVGYWKSEEDILKHRKVDKRFKPKMGEEEREKLYNGWKRAIERSLDWAH
ncbi:MAG: glycerol kinase [Candidatus Methanolliviera hydrocarbonicum]|uniref:glycerol kinase n=1 Tax=Candidatus Methanolliviera hydrocarbonicum TaxID=2491085 RepID=A0A520KUI3_9EURY|nr:MAG: glycerol kinase [Candidatus Methanolliviera hydrocarbonicum]